MRLTEIRKEPMFQAVYSEVAKSVAAEFVDIPEDRLAAAADRAAYKAVQAYLNRSNNQSAIHAQKCDQIESAVRKLAGLVNRRMTIPGTRFDRTLIGDLCKRINRQKKIAFGAKDSADENVLDEQWRWLKSIERSILSCEGMEGVPPWLR